MQKMEFKRAGHTQEGETLFDYYLGGALIRHSLTIDEVVAIISDEDPDDRSPGRIRTPENSRAGWQRR